MMEEIDFSKLPKKERKRLKRELEKSELEKKAGRGRIIKLVFLTAGVALVALIILWLINEGGKPLPGQSVSDLGREHVAREQWEKFSYNSNPPTSGPHDSTWSKAGIYDSPQGDGNLIHALEHGYVIISYNCVEDSQDCQNLKKQLSGLANEKRLWKLIVVPRPSLDVPIALTAWGKIDKLDKFDSEKINRFIDAYRNHGPEATPD